MPLSSVAQTLLDTAPERVFDTLTKLTSRLLGVPVSLVSILDEYRQFFKSQCGLPEPWATRRETPLTHSFCQHVAATGAPFIVEDARTDPRVQGNLAVPDLGVIAYLGVPLFDDEQVAYGALCAIDSQPRRWSEEDIETLQVLAAQVMNEISLRGSLLEHQAQAEAARVAERNRILAARSDRHDLRTPLNAMLLSIQGVRLLGDLNEDQAISLTLAEKNGREVSKMIDQMLDIGSVDSHGGEALSKQAFLPLELIARAVGQVSALAGEKQQTIKSSTEALRALIVDEEKIVRVLVNLLANAIKFTPEGGSIEVAAAGAVEGGRPAVLFTVHDSGIGLSEANLVRIFSEGFRVDAHAPTHRSTGLGLTFCKRIVEAHEGKIWAESQPGLGATFRFWIPA